MLVSLHFLVNSSAAPLRGFPDDKLFLRTANRIFVWTSLIIKLNSLTKTSIITFFFFHSLLCMFANRPKDVGKRSYSPASDI